MEIKGLQIKWLGHDSFRIEKENKIIYFDPFEIKKYYNDADLVLITHNHYDHYSIKDIEKVANENTTVILPKSIEEETKKLKFNKVFLYPNSEITIKDIKIKSVPAYNVDKNYHKKEEGWLGYIVEINNIKIYHAGDTDLIPEMNVIHTDIALLPVSGVYVMDPYEAANAVNVIMPEYAIPMHYGSIVGSKQEAEIFKKEASAFTKVIILEKEE